MEYDGLDGLFYGLYQRGGSSVWTYFSFEEFQNDPSIRLDPSFIHCRLSNIMVSLENGVGNLI